MGREKSHQQGFTGCTGLDCGRVRGGELMGEFGEVLVPVFLGHWYFEFRNAGSLLALGL